MRRNATTGHWLPFSLVLIFLFSLPNMRVSAAVIRVDEACSLHHAITAANTDEASGGCPAGAGADTIYLTGDVILSEELPVIRTVISIDGGGFAISGDKRYRIFRVGERPFGDDEYGVEIKLTINRLDLTEARGDLGSAMYIALGAEVNIYESKVTDSYAREGGAIFNWGQLKISGSTFSNNLAGDSGGALENHGSATLAVFNSSFSNNSAGSQGGAIFSSGAAAVEASSFLRNAALEGGAIYSVDDELTVLNSTFSQNTGADAGGALYLNQSAATLTHLTIYGSESRDGGGMYRDGGSVSLVNSIIGGSLESADCVGAIDENHGNLIEDGSCGPAFSGPPLLQPLSGSPANYRLFGGSRAIHNGVVEYCARRDQLGNIRRWSYDCDIGAIEVKGDRENLDRAPETANPSAEMTCTLADKIRAANRDEAVGACPAGDGAVTIHVERDMTLTEPLPRITSEILIIGNQHTISGAYQWRIFDISAQGQLRIHDLNMIRGKHAIQGGAIRLLGGSLKISNSSIRDSHSGYGGAIYVEGGTLGIENSKLSGNWAHFSGGAISSLEGAALTISASSINNNVSRGGGAISAWDGTATLTDSTLSHNSAHYGGAIYSGGWQLESRPITEDNTFRIVDSTISHNSATHYGGAINNSAMLLAVTGSTFSNNQAGAAGGALIMVHGTLIAESSSFVENTAEDIGGAIYSESSEYLEIMNSTFSGNSADEGGALRVVHGTLTHVTIADNLANETGGIALYSGVSLRNSIVSGNSGGDCAFFNHRNEVANNLIGDGSCDAELASDPMLDEFSAELGFHPLLPDSPAIDAADPAHCPPTDQLGTVRPQGGGCDIGAIEFTGD